MAFPPDIQVHPMFASAFNKAQWACQYLMLLEGNVTAYAEHGVRSNLTMNHGPRGDILFHVECDPMPYPLGLSVGDICRNLRDALDHFVSAVERVHSGSDSRKVFPVDEDLKTLAGKLPATYGGPEYQHVSDAILNEIKPTKADNFPIWAMNKLNNADKHREIAVVTTISMVPFPNLTGENGAMMRNNSLCLEPGASRDFPFPGTLKVEGEDHLYKETMVRFGGAEKHLRGEDVVPFLHKAADAVCDALIKLQAAYLKTLPV